MVAVVNSVLAGVFAWLIASMVASGPLLPAVCAAAALLLSLVSLFAMGERAFNRDLQMTPVVFPAEPGADRPDAGREP